MPRFTLSVEFKKQIGAYVMKGRSLTLLGAFAQ